MKWRRWLGANLALISPIGLMACTTDNSVLVTPNAWDVSDSRRQDLIQEAKVNADLNVTNEGFGQHIWYLSNAKYNQIYQQIQDHEVAIVIIANQHIYKDFVPTDEILSCIEVMQNSQFEWKVFQHQALGTWVKTFKIDGTNQWLHGSSNDQNYHDFYPLIFWNHTYSLLGVSNFSPRGHDVIEISYDY